MEGENWQLGAVCIVAASVLAGCSLVSYSAILCDISTEEERDRVSSRGWAFGYLGGGLLLVVNLALVLGNDAIGLSTGHGRAHLACSRPRCGGPRSRSSRSCGCGTGRRSTSSPSPEGCFQRSFGQLFATLKDLRNYPMTLTFLLAYLFYNDGIQTVIYSASVYGSEELGFGTSVLIATILLIQFVAFGGALFFGRLAAKYGAYRSILYGCYVWMVIVVVAMFLPEKNIALFLAVGIAIGIVLGGTQALSRSFFSLLIPRGREGEYFALYHAFERGTSWFGVLLFGVMFQVTGSYRPAIVSLIIFFVLGVIFLLRLDPVRGIREAGNTVPASLL